MKQVSSLLASNPVSRHSSGGVMECIGGEKFLQAPLMLV